MGKSEVIKKEVNKGRKLRPVRRPPRKLLEHGSPRTELPPRAAKMPSFIELSSTDDESDVPESVETKRPLSKAPRPARVLSKPKPIVKPKTLPPKKISDRDILLSILESDGEESPVSKTVAEVKSKEQSTVGSERKTKVNDSSEKSGESAVNTKSLKQTEVKPLSPSSAKRNKAKPEESAKTTKSSVKSKEVVAKKTNKSEMSSKKPKEDEEEVAEKPTAGNTTPQDEQVESPSDGSSDETGEVDDAVEEDTKPNRLAVRGRKRRKKRVVPPKKRVVSNDVSSGKVTPGSPKPVKSKQRSTSSKSTVDTVTKVGRQARVRKPAKKFMYSDPETCSEDESIEEIVKSRRKKKVIVEVKKPEPEYAEVWEETMERRDLPEKRPSKTNGKRSVKLEFEEPPKKQVINLSLPPLTANSNNEAAVANNIRVGLGPDIVVSRLKKETPSSPSVPSASPSVVDKSGDSMSSRSTESQKKRDSTKVSLEDLERLAEKTSQVPLKDSKFILILKTTPKVSPPTTPPSATPPPPSSPAPAPAPAPKKTPESSPRGKQTAKVTPLQTPQSNETTDVEPVKPPPSSPSPVITYKKGYSKAFQRHFSIKESYCEHYSSLDSDSSEEGEFFAHFVNLRRRNDSVKEDQPNHLVFSGAPTTIHDIMLDVSQEFPKWNLHILPEGNHYYLVQLDHGPMGLPVMRKYIVIDINFNAKAYLNHTLLEEFLGVYDSYESIRQLIVDVEQV